MSQPRLMKLVIIALSLATILGLSFALLSSKSKKAHDTKLELTLQTLPNDAKISFDEATYHGTPQKLNLAAGRYTVKIERFGFRSVQYVLELKQNQVEYIALEPISQSAQAWKKQNYKLYQDFYSRISRANEARSKALSEQYPLLSRLPKHSGQYQIGANGRRIIIHASPDNQYRAVEALKRERVDLSQYHYRFQDDQAPDQETNPFKIENPNL